jgi:hypothetical protein
MTGAEGLELVVEGLELLVDGLELVVGAAELVTVWLWALFVEEVASVAVDVLCAEVLESAVTVVWCACA